MARFFNTAGPQKPEIHYTLPPLGRWDLQEILQLIDQQKYFILHAPRQTGKTSCLLALMEYLNKQGRYRALYANIEPAQTAREDVGRGIRTVVQCIGQEALAWLGDKATTTLGAEVLQTTEPDGALTGFLAKWAAESGKPSVLMIDEIDSLVGDTLISVLRQLRAGYARRPLQFPQSVILCGVRDLQDYRIHSTQAKGMITGGSAFNIKAESLRLGNFRREDIAALCLQHTEETGQLFEQGALDTAWELSEGQPWLVNALAYEATSKMAANRDRSRPITAEIMEQASERLILSRTTHLDQLTDKLQEERVRRVIGPILAGESEPERLPSDDVQYVEDLGLIVGRPQLRIANRIYREVIPRELTWTTQLTITHQTFWYVTPEGRLDFPKLLAAFQQFFREHGEHWVERFDYKEAGPQLLLQAFLQRVVNGGGRIEREYGLGRGRTDLLVLWPLHPHGTDLSAVISQPESVQRAVIELKLVLSLGREMLAEAVEQTSRYMDSCGASEGHLLLFDRRKERTWEEKIYRREERSLSGRVITVWGA